MALLLSSAQFERLYGLRYPCLLNKGLVLEHLLALGGAGLKDALTTTVASVTQVETRQDEYKNSHKKDRSFSDLLNMNF